jgi:hypothetical protein
MTTLQMSKSQAAWLARASRKGTILGYSILPDGRMTVAVRSFDTGERIVSVVERDR